MRPVLWAAAALTACAASAAAPLCATGLKTSLHDHVVCCPRSCKTCDEVQCQRRNAKCCPAQIYKGGRACARAADVGCVHRRDSAADGARNRGARVAGFCRAGTRGNERRVATCCAPACDRCDALGCGSDGGGGECCGPVVAARNETCAAAGDVGCVGTRPELDVASFKGAARDGARGDTVHVVIAGDRVQSLGVLACAASAAESTLDPARLSLRVRRASAPPSISFFSPRYIGTSSWTRRALRRWRRPCGACSRRAVEGRRGR